MGAPLWRRRWLGYSNVDGRYEWITIDSVNPTMMIYSGAPGSATAHPIVMEGAFTDQGVAGEETVGKRVGMRTVIRIESDDRHMFELYFRRPGDKEVLAATDDLRAGAAVSFRRAALDGSRDRRG
jgi:Protein of unknown function (DUF1579)